MIGKRSVVVVCLTPFDAKGQLDEQAFRRQLGRLCDAGVAVYVAGSGSGEGYSLNPEELDRVLAIAVEELKGKTQFRAMGCEPRNAGEMIQFMKHCERSKIDAAQIFSLEIGHGAKPTNAELLQYYSTVIESTSMPIYLSSHQAAGYILPMEVVETLVNRFPQIAGINYGGTDTVYLSELIHRMKDRIEVHCAGPANALTVLGLGGNGFMGAEGNFMPTLVASVIKAYEANDADLLRTSFRKLMAFVGLHNKYANGASSMRGMKPLMSAFGLPGGYLRPPRIPISGQPLEELIKATIALDIPGVPPRLGASKS
jgi:4-hydroxy-tetrahydrodipicolinate synthase